MLDILKLCVNINVNKLHKSDYTGVSEMNYVVQSLNN